MGRRALAFLLQECGSFRKAGASGPQVDVN